MPSLRRSVLSTMIFCNASARRFTSSLGTSRPFELSRTKSGIPTRRVETAATPHAMDSISTCGRPSISPSASRLHGNAKTSAECNIAGSSSCKTVLPVTFTVFCRSRRAICFRSFSSQGPEPAIRHSKSRPRSLNKKQASIKSSNPFFPQAANA